MRHSKEFLFREIEDFGYAEPKGAIETISDFLAWLDASDIGIVIDERVSDALKRLKFFVGEVDLADPLGMFLDEVIKFRLKEYHGIENPSQELVDQINFDGFDDCEYVFDYGYIDNVITEQLEIYDENTKETK